MPEDLPVHSSAPRLTLDETKQLSELLTKLRLRILGELSDGFNNALLRALDITASTAWAAAAEDDGSLLHSHAVAIDNVLDA